MKINEIEKLKVSDYPGGESDFGNKMSKIVKDLPGGSGFRYSIVKDSTYVVIKLFDSSSDDPKPTEDHPSLRTLPPWKKNWVLKDMLDRWKKRQAYKLGPQIGELSVFPSRFPTGKVMVVNTINVHKDYRGMGIAKALYGIVLSELKMQLMSGDSQTPGGMRNWVSLNNIPGVKVRGYVKIGKYYLEESPPEEKAKLQADLDLLNAEYVGTTGSKSHGHHCWLFDVAPNQSGTELAALAKTKIIKVYADSDWSFEAGLIASWGG